MSAFNTPWFNNQDRSFFNVLNISKIAHVILTAETDDFDGETEQQWKDEGFHIQYAPFDKGGTEFIQRLHNVGENFEVSEQYAIVAYGEAASLTLEHHQKPNNPKLVAIVAYYPTAIPSPTTKFPSSIQVLVHLAGTEISVHKQNQVLGIQGKRTTLRKRIDPGIGYGEGLKLAFKAYTYTGVQPGFAEHDLEEYDPIADGIAFTRSIACVRKGFRVENDIEAVRDHHARFTFSAAQTDRTISHIRPCAHVLHAPTLIGGVGTEGLREFYEEFFTPVPANGNTEIRLLSRTIGTDRIVDEMFVGLAHEVEMEWLLPGVPPTMRRIEIVIVSVFHVRGEKVESEHVYWDQASVLVQVS